jgi:hypothetical protein
MFYCYGEDSLTLWMLRHHLDLFLLELKDYSRPDKCVVFYRPSFGRRNSGINHPSFGEFDCIILSEFKVYLVESKWEKIKPLEANQVFRHEVLAEYIDNIGSIRWNASLRITGKKTPRTSTTLFQTLDSVLDSIQKKLPPHPSVKNIYLLFHRGRWGTSPTSIGGFTVGWPTSLTLHYVKSFIPFCFNYSFASFLGSSNFILCP